MFSFLDLFIPAAHAAQAETAQNAPQGGGISFFVMMGVIFLFIYFAMWRPQSKRAKEQQNLLSSLAKGDEVITAGGLLGRIQKISDQYLTIAVSESTNIFVQKSSILSVLPKGTLKSLE